MAEKTENGKSKTPKQAARRSSLGTRSQRAAMSDFDAAVEASQRHVTDVQAHATKALTTAVKDIQKRQKKLKDEVAAIANKSTMSAEAKVSATQNALNDFDAFLARVAAGIDKERATLGERASALRKQLDKLKSEAVRHTEKDYAKAERALKDFDRYVAKSAASLEKEVVSFMERAELQLKSMGETIAIYSAKSADMAREGRRGVADFWKDLKHSQRNAQKQINTFSKSSARAWNDISNGLGRAWSELGKAGKMAASRYGSTAKRGAAKRVASSTAKSGGKEAKAAAKKPRKTRPKSSSSIGSAAPSRKKAASAGKPAAIRGNTPAAAKPAKC